MECEPIAAATSSPPHDVTPEVPFPAHDHDVTLVGDPEVLSPPSDDREVTVVGSPEVKFPPSDDDHPSDAVVLTDDLRDKIIQQVEYYFSDENLPNDKFMMESIKKNKEGFVPIGVIASFKKMKRLVRDKHLIAAALKESSLLVVSPDCKKVKRLHPLLLAEAQDPEVCTVLVENLPDDHSIDNIQRIFHKAGKVKNISIHDPLSEEKSKKFSKNEKFLSGKLHALVEYDCIGAAEKAVATLNNGDDWRNGLRVKLLTQGVKAGQKKKPWREAEIEKHNDIQGSGHTGDEGNRNLNVHHDETLNEEDGEHVLSEKTGYNRGRRQGRSKVQKYHSTTGLGHGTTSSTYIPEASKAPPGPKMPDGTRGFTMGRGRPIITNQS